MRAKKTTKARVNRPKNDTQTLLRAATATPLTAKDITAQHALVLLRGFWTMLIAGSRQSYTEQYRKVLEYYKRLQTIVEIHGKVRKSVAAKMMTPAEATALHDKALRELCSSVGLDERAGRTPFRPGEPDTVERTAAQFVHLAMVLEASVKHGLRSSQDRAADKALDDIWRTIWIPPEARAEFERDAKLTPANLDCTSGPVPTVKDLIHMLNAVR